MWSQFKRPNRWQVLLAVLFGVLVAVLALSLEEGFGSNSSISKEPEVLRTEIEQMLTFRHVEEPPQEYLGPDWTLTEDYSASLEGCWLTITVVRPDEAFCRVGDLRTQTHIVENNIGFSERIELREHRGVSILRFWPVPAGLPDLNSSELASRTARRQCNGDTWSGEDKDHLEAFVFPLGTVDGVAERLVAYRRAVCPTFLDYARFFRH